MKQLLSISLFLFSLSFFAQNDSGITPKIAIKLNKGETLKLHDVTLTFTEVIEDSRCPKYTNCIWAGRAIVQIEVLDEKGIKQDKTIVLGETKGDESADKTLFRKDGYSIEVIGLHPYPEEGSALTPYRLLISEGK
jgi:hypothetical protein